MRSAKDVIGAGASEIDAEMRSCERCAKDECLRESVGLPACNVNLLVVRHNVGA